MVGKREKRGGKGVDPIFKRVLGKEKDDGDGSWEKEKMMDVDGCDVGDFPCFYRERVANLLGFYHILIAFYLISKSIRAFVGEEPTPSPNSSLTIAKHSLRRSPSATPPSPNTTGCAIAPHRPVRPPALSSPYTSFAFAVEQFGHQFSDAIACLLLRHHFSDPPANRSEATADADALPPPKMLSDALHPPALPHSRPPRYTRSSFTRKRNAEKERERREVAGTSPEERSPESSTATAFTSPLPTPSPIGGRCRRLRRGRPEPTPLLAKGPEDRRRNSPPPLATLTTASRRNRHRRHAPACLRSRE
nr:hypothetical protein Iba_chr11bCG14440 [Ipomoea batatas]